MKEVKKFYQIAVVITETDKRMLAAVRNEEGKTLPVLNLSGDEAVTRYEGLMDLLERPPTTN